MEKLNYDSDASTEGVMGDADLDRGDDIPNVGNGHGPPASEAENVDVDPGPGCEHRLADAAIRTQLGPVSQAMDSFSEDSSKQNAVSLKRVELLDSRLNRVEYIDEIFVPQFGSSPAAVTNIRRLSHVERRWKGADWSLLLIINPCFDTMDVYWGIERPDTLPDNWSRSMSFTISLLDQKLTTVKEASLITHLFFSTNKSAARIDCGQRGMFPASAVQLYGCKTPVKGLSLLRFKVEAVEHFVPTRAPLHYNSKELTSMVGLENLGATCYLNSLLQMLYHINAFRDAVYRLPIDADDPAQSTTLALQSVFVNLQTADTEVTTKDLTKAFGWTSAEAFMQQDVQEMMRVLLDKLEEKVHEYNKKHQEENGGTKMPINFIKSMFAGKIKSFIHCINIDYQSNREEDFYDIQLDVKDCTNIYDSFARYIEIEMLEGDNQYYCEEHKGKFDAKKGVIFTSFAPILTIHLKRFDFDLQSMSFMKIHDYYEFPSLLYLDDFLEKSSSEAKDAVTSNTYVLHSVLVHSGDVGGGHYYAYIRPATEYNLETVYNIDYVRRKIESARQGESMVTDASSDEDSIPHSWYKFNDEVVIRVKELEAVHYCYGRKFMARRADRGAHVMSPNINAAPAAAASADSVANLEAKVKSYKENNRIFTDCIEDHNTINYNTPSHSSAYMLVYIRLEEAHSLMQPIHVDSIPRPLTDRLTRINKQKRFHEEVKALEKSILRVKYGLENDLVHFKASNRTQFFLSGHELTEMLMVRGSQRLGLVLHLSKTYGVLPIYLALWTLEYSKGGAVNLSDTIAAGEYGAYMGVNEKHGVDDEDTVFFVQMLYNTSATCSSAGANRRRHAVDLRDTPENEPRIRSSEHLLNSVLQRLGPKHSKYHKLVNNLYHCSSNYHLFNHMTFEELTTFIHQYEALLESEELWKSKLGKQMDRYFGAEYAEQRQLAEELNSTIGQLIYGDVLFGSGIGMANPQLNRLEAVGCAKVAELRQELVQLTIRMSNLITEFSIKMDDEEYDHCVVMVRLFDPYNLFHCPALGPESHYAKSIDLSQPATKEHLCTDPRGNLSHVEGVEDVHGGVEFFVAGEPAEYIPLKYMGYIMLDLSAALTSLTPLVRTLMAMNHVQMDSSLQENDLQFDFFLLESPSKCKPLIPDAVKKEWMHVSNSMSAVLVCSLSKETYAHRFGSPSRLPVYTPQLAGSGGRVFVNTSTRIYDQRTDPISSKFYSKSAILCYNYLLSVTAERVEIYDNRYTAVKQAHLSRLKSEDSNLNLEDEPTVAPPLSFAPGPYVKYRQFRRECVVLPLEQRDLHALLRAHKYFNVNDIQSHLLASSASAKPNGKRTFDAMTSKALSSRQPVCCGFVMHIFSQMRIADLVALVANRLQLHYSHLSLLIADETNLYDSILMASPVTIFSEGSLAEHVTRAKAKLSRGSLLKLTVFYKILDHSLVKNILMCGSAAQIQTPSLLSALISTPYSGLPRSRRVVDILVNDVRLRFWRALYLDHVQGITESYCVDNSLSVYPPRRESEVIEIDLDSPDSGIGHGSVKRARTETDNGAEAPVSCVSDEDSPIISAEDLASILWPAENIYSRNPYASRDRRSVSLQLPVDMQVGELCAALRASLAIPLNVQQLLAAQSGLALAYNSCCRLDDSETGPDDGVVSQELLNRCHIAQSSAPTAFPATPCNLSSEILSATGDQMNPFYALMVCTIRECIIDDICSVVYPVQDLVKAWGDMMDTSLAQLYQMSTQILDSQDIPYMLHRDLHPDLFSFARSRSNSSGSLGSLSSQPKSPASPHGSTAALVGPASSSLEGFEDSMVLSVFYFTLYGGSCEPCDPTLFNGPFLTFVRRSDSYSSLVDRLVRITGDKDMAKYRLAIVSRKKEPTFIVANGRATAASGTPSVGDVEAASAHHLWEQFAKRYTPNSHLQNEDRRRGAVDSMHRKFAWLGIQRSVNDVQAAVAGTIHAMRFKGQASTGIKIT